MNTFYRTHTCNDLRVQEAGKTVRLSGWIHRKRDHGQLLFIDLRDHFGITQCVISSSAMCFKELEELRLESVVTLTGEVVKRTPETINSLMPTGEIELSVEDVTVQSKADVLPLTVISDAEFPEETRLRYRFLDLRREKMHANIVLRCQVIAA